MEAQSLDEKGLSDKAEALLSLIRKSPAGEHLGNISLRSRLQKDGVQWSEDEYWEAQEELRAKGFIETGRGRGGALWLLEPGTEPTGLEGEVKGLVEDEWDLYQPLVNWITEFLGHDAKERDDFFLAKITASKRKQETGIWSRPDVSLIQVNKFDYLPTPQLETSSFEVKRYYSGDMLESIYEAAAHARWVHNSWLVVEDSEASPKRFSKRFNTELDRFGVGLMTMRRKDSGYVFEVVSEPATKAPDLLELDEFLRVFFTEEGGKADQRNLRRFLTMMGK